MKKLNVAIIGQGRSGKDIHGKYFRTEDNQFYCVKYVVDKDPFRRGVAEEIHPGCKTFADYTELYALDDIDLVVNATYSEMHYPITRDLLLHGKNVLVEKPFGRTRYECDELIKIAKEQGVTLAVFQQTFLAPFYEFVRDTVKSGKLGEVLQVSIRYNNFARRWDWQTLQKKCAGGAFNTGPHPIGMRLGFLDIDSNTTGTVDTNMNVNEEDNVYINLYSQEKLFVVNVHLGKYYGIDSTVKVGGFRVGETVSYDDVLKAVKKQYNVSSLKMYTYDNWCKVVEGKTSSTSPYFQVHDGDNVYEVYVSGSRKTTSASGSSSATADSSNPKTGDMIFAPVAVMGLSVSALAVLFFLNKKRAF